MQPLFSIVVPMKNESENVAALVEELTACCRPLGAYELWLVDDGSSDGTSDAIQSMQADCPELKLLRHEECAGQSAAIHNGVLQARAPIVCTLDGDGQNPPDQIPNLLKPLLAADADPSLALVAGQRVRRQDSLSKRYASQFANALRSRILRDGSRDTGCGLKAFRRDAFLALPYFNHMHRFLPALFKRDGWTIVHVDVTHRPRMAGQSKYNNLSRAVVGLYDLLGVAWLIRRRKPEAARTFSIVTGGR
jgi:glycosyltransferase involved in cell wall biosynthesis